MKLLVVSSWFPYPPDNGSKLRAFHLLSQLSKRHDITLLSFSESGEEEGLAALKDVCRDVRTVSGNPCKPVAALRARDLISATPRSYVQTYSPRMQELVDAAVPHHDAAVAFQCGAALYLAKHSTIPRVFDEAEAGVIRDAFRTRPPGLVRYRRGLTWWKYGYFLRHLVDAFERTTVVSEIEREHLAEAHCDLSALRVVPNGVDRQALMRRNEPRPGRMIYSGAVTYSANLDAVRYFVRDILPLIRRARPATLVVTGSTGGVDVSDLLAGGSVTFTGRVPDIDHLVAHSSVSIVPLRLGGGTRLKILEAMALGTPVVTTPKGAEGLAVEHGQHLLIANSPEAFAQETLRVMNDFVLHARLAANGRRLVERLYTWDRIGNLLDEVIDEARTVHRGHAPSASSLAETRRSATA
jgi:glycosyltransferase involved in cell wall biosynthesis